jgi:sugar phosphate isomerase/epimerase
LTNLSRRRHYKLDEDVIAKMREYAASGAALEHIAPAIGVSYCSLKNWLSNARGDNPTELELDLLAAYNEGRAAGALKFASLIHKAAEEGDARSAQWMLTHSPHYRRHYSDSAAERRAFRDGLELAATAAAEAGLSPEQERKLLLHLQAKSGERLQAADEAS